MAWTFPSSWSTGQVPTAADFAAIHADDVTWGGDVNAGANRLTNCLNLYTTGAVGIATATPRAALDVNLAGGIAVTPAANIGAVDYTLSPWTSGGGVTGWNKSGGDGEMSLVSLSGGGGADGGFSFYWQNTQLMRIKKNGNVAILLSGVPIFANNAAAITGGLSAGYLYRTNSNPDTLCIVH